MTGRIFQNNNLLFRIFPFIQWLRGYSWQMFRADSLAGLTVAVVLIPQSMAYAMLAGLPPVYGLYAAAITPIIGGLWGSLRQLATGPIAIMSLLVLTTLAPLAEPGSRQFIDLALVLSILVGAIYLSVGIAGMGQVMSFISHSAVKGFTSAAALIIIAAQIPNLLGLSTERHEFIIFMLIEIGKNLSGFHPATVLIGVSCFVFIYFVKKYRPAFPAGLVALVASTGAVALLKLHEAGVAVAGKSPGGLAGFYLPSVAPETLSNLIGPAVVIALVSFAETYSVSKAVASESKQKIDVNQEFVGQGLANLIGGFFQCYPVSGSFSRTAVNFAAGAKTAISSVVSGLLVIFALLFLTPLFTYIPKAALAAVVISAVMTLFHPREVLSLWRQNKDDGIVAVTVFVLALAVKPDYALMIGVAASLIFFMWKTMHPRIVQITKDPEINVFVNADAADKPGCPQILHLRSDNVIFFANAEYTVAHILERVDAVRTPLVYVLLDFQAVGFIDITAIDELRALKDELAARDMGLAIFHVHQPVMKTFVSSGFIHEIGETGIVRQAGLTDRHGEVLAAIFKQIDHGYCHDICPYVLFYECSIVK
ncbi:SulP family sulfate permease [Desulfosalsimonas propionicica]|uniref:SulP family sulfate permease n=1 Tax=Desulfosalsimonas propionicica TaxID=332175 RepID=A0A7W0HJU7_9BACT|nr:sulfate permease [Desulfosalsimonas propionicica]MBA2880565.1 SulP family sulfate permease [Desulfosalsimonas propionicica]